MAANKTKPTDADPRAYVAAVEHPTRRADAEVLLELFERVTGCPPVMWGPSIVGFGRYRYDYKSGRTDEWLLTGFAPRKSNLVIYVMAGYEEQGDALDRLGKHRTGQSCLYINKLADVDLAVLEEIVVEGIAEIRERHEILEG